LPAGDGHPFRPQDVADLALGDGYSELLLEALDQFCLSQGRVLLFLRAQPGSALWRYLVRMAVTVVKERFPGGSSLAVAAAQERQGARLEAQTQFLAECLKVLAMVEALEELLLGQGSVDLTDGVSFHPNSPDSRWLHDTTNVALWQVLDW